MQATKTNLYDFVLASCRLLLKRYLDTSVSALTLQENIDGGLALWKAIISVQKYGTNYLADRAEVTLFHQIHLMRETAAEQIEQFLRNNGNFYRVAKYSMHRFISSASNQISYPSRLIPPNAICSIGYKFLQFVGRSSCLALRRY